MDYQSFLSQKRSLVEDSGFDIDESNLSPHLFDWQKKCVKWALMKGKSAEFFGCGLGKTICQLDWASKVCDHSGGDVLILARELGMPVYFEIEHLVKDNL